MAVTNDLATDRRVLRHADALRNAGYDIVLVCRERYAADSTMSRALPATHHPLPTRHRRGWLFYAEYNHRLWRQLLSIKPDAVWANDIDTLPGAWMAARQLRCPLVMDAHELFPEVPEIQHKPVVKWVWRTIERHLMPKCNALLTVCQSLADYYRKLYGVDMTVVRNVPDVVEYQARPDHSAHQGKTLLYQGCINLGRGVDWAIDALEYLPQCRLVLAGGGDILEQMKTYAASKPWANRIEFLGKVSPEELPALMRKADVGLVMLEHMGLSYYYALPNRIGDFVAAGVPMVVSDMPEMSAVVRKYGVGEIIERGHAGHPSNAKLLAESVERVLARNWTDADFAEARNDMNWNKEKQKLLNIVENLKLKT